MRILLTGATGFVGGHLIELLGARHQVMAIVRHPETSRSPRLAAAIPMDLAGPLDHDRLPASVDVVIHLAQAKAEAAAGPDHQGVNVVATQRLLEYARSAGAAQFMLASSGDVYGNRRGLATETDPVAPESDYARSKRDAELCVAASSRHLAGCVLRLFQPYGPGQTGRLIPKLAERIRAGAPVDVTSTGGPQVSPIYVDDIVRAIDRALEIRHAGVVNVAGDRAVSLRELAAAIGSRVGRSPCFAVVEGDRADLAGDNHLMKSAFGDWPLVPLAAGLARTFGG